MAHKDVGNATNVEIKNFERGKHAKKGTSLLVRSRGDSKVPLA